MAHYSTLGLARTASPALIRAAYLDAAKRLQPDKNPSPEATAKMQTVQRAYDCLSDPTQRLYYDTMKSHKGHDAETARPTVDYAENLAPVVAGLTLIGGLTVVYIVYRFFLFISPAVHWIGGWKVAGGTIWIGHCFGWRVAVLGLATWTAFEILA